MDREWMLKSRLSQEYADGVEYFIKFAIDHGANPTKTRCPCKNCSNAKWISIDQIRDHLIIDGISPLYTRWIYHGQQDSEHLENPSTESAEIDGMFDDDQLDDLVRDVEDNFQGRPDLFENLISDAHKPLYVGCNRFTRLSALLKLYNLKVSNGWTDKSFTTLLQLLKEMLPEDNCLPERTYEAKKFLRSIGLNYNKIHACPNDCILYRKEYEMLQNCPEPTCGAPRYKKNGTPSKVLWYFPIIPRFRRMFNSPKDAQNLTWHANERIKDGKLRHPTDSPQWKTIDALYPEFGHEDRNLRLALSSDGMNPYGNLSSSHSTWPVVLVIYNLPPELCMKRRYMMLSLLISGPKQPGNDIDVYLAPLIEDLQILWQEGIEVYDAFRLQSFRLRAMLFCTINDFPAYGNLSGYTVKGHYACPICMRNTCHCQLNESKKTVFLQTRIFLPEDHRYRRLCKAFNGSPEEGKAPIPLSGEQVFNLVKDVNVTFGKTTKAVSVDGWKKRSIFFDLSYWKDLFVRHCLDVMHIEKNICDSVVGTLLNMPGKSKDGVKARQDYLQLKIREELAPVRGEGSRTYLPPACYTLSKKEKEVFCNVLDSIKVPEGYSSNIKSLVSLKDLKLTGMKSHDCHILMQQMLPIAIRSILPKEVRLSITRLCFFFRKLCSKVINPQEISELQKNVVETICQLEMYFPPAFFDIMVHLTVHLVREVQLCGPVYLRWMYPFERYMKILKGYVKNPNRPEGCIVERYIVEEAIEFCSDYLSDVEAIGLPRRHYSPKVEWRGKSRGNPINISNEMWTKAHLYVLHNTEEVEPYVAEHKNYVKRGNLRHARNEWWLTNEHNRTFIYWFRKVILEKIESGEDISENLKWIAQGPRHQVMSYTSVEVKNVTFCTKGVDDRSTTQNSGVTLLAQAMHVSSAKDKNPVIASMSYYGAIEEIWVLIYSDKIQIPVFCCKWADNNNGVKIDESGFTLVNMSKARHTEEPFILATQAKQIFYVSDPSNQGWSVVLSSPTRNTYEESDDICEESSSVFLATPPPHDGEDEDHDTYIRADHMEGIWLNDQTQGQGGNSSSSNLNKKRKQT